LEGSELSVFGFDVGTTTPKNRSLEQSPEKSFCGFCINMFHPRASGEAGISVSSTPTASG